MTRDVTSHPRGALGARLGRAALIILIAVGTAWLLTCRATVSCEVAVREPGAASTALEGCFYFDQGRGLVESDHACFAYAAAPAQELVTYSVALGNLLPIRRLRFDPLPSAGVVALRRMTLTVGVWSTAVDFNTIAGRPPGDAHAMQSSVHGDDLVLNLLGNDPYVTVIDDLGGRSSVRAALVFALCLPLAWLLSRAAARIGHSVRPRRLARYAWWLPVAAIAFLGFRALILWRAYPTDISFEIALRARAVPAESLEGCFFYDVGNGFFENQKVCFPYDRRPPDAFQRYTVRIHSVADVRALRFDPSNHPGTIALRNVQLTTANGTQSLARADDFARTLYALSNTQLEHSGGELRVQMSGRDPQIMLSSRLPPRGTSERRRAAAGAAVAALLAAALAAALGAKVAPAFRGLARMLERARHTSAPFARAAVLGFLVCAVGVRLAVAFASHARYERLLSAGEWLRLPSSDLIIVLTAGTLLWLLDHVPIRSVSAAALVPCLVVVSLETLIGTALWLLAVMYLLSAYVFWEWGAFLDGDTLRVIYRSPVPESVRHYLVQPAMLAIVLWAGVCVAASVVLYRVLQSGRLRNSLLWVVLLAAWSATAIDPIRDPYRFDAAVASPLFLAMRHEPLQSTELGLAAPADGIKELDPPRMRPVPQPLSELRGAAAGRDVILVVLESVRRSNLELYGYHRETMPNLTALAARGLVFSAAYATQPRSSKTLDALLMGVDPDPRMEPFTWTPERVVSAKHFPGMLRERGYRFYFGIGWHPSTDGFLDIVQALAGSALDRVVGLEDLVASSDPGEELTDDERLVEDFLAWYGPRTDRTAALIWLQGGHHPYSAPRKNFPEETVVDRYDNCLYSVDQAIARLHSGLGRAGKQPLIAVFGDHGEAFGEHVGDVLHGNFLYDQSIRVPFVILLDSPALVSRRNIDARFSMKDVPATLLYLLGIEEPLGQSEVVFSKTSGDKLYLSTVYGDYKLGLIQDNYKLVLRPHRRLRYLFDLTADPAEQRNVLADHPGADVDAMEADVIGWYFAQIAYLERTYPRVEPLGN